MSVPLLTQPRMARLGVYLGDEFLGVHLVEQALHRFLRSEQWLTFPPDPKATRFHCATEPISPVHCFNIDYSEVVFGDEFVQSADYRFPIFFDAAALEKREPSCSDLCHFQSFPSSILGAGIAPLYWLGPAFRAGLVVYLGGRSAAVSLNGSVTAPTNCSGATCKRSSPCPVHRPRRTSHDRVLFPHSQKSSAHVPIRS